MKKVKVTLKFEDENGKIVEKHLFGNPWTVDIDDESKFRGLMIDEVAKVISSTIREDIRNTDLIRDAVTEILGGEK